MTLSPSYDEQLCACGRPLHYTVPAIRVCIEELIAKLGSTVVIDTVRGSWRVPRHYIALHGLKERELPELARLLGFQEEPC